MDQKLFKEIIWVKNIPLELLYLFNISDNIVYYMYYFIIYFGFSFYFFNCKKDYINIVSLSFK